MVRSWTLPLATLRSALNGIEDRVCLERIDIEPALHAAMVRGDFDLVILDPALAALPRKIVESELREHGHETPLVVLEDVAMIAPAVRRALDARRC